MRRAVDKRPATDVLAVPERTLRASYAFAAACLALAGCAQAADEPAADAVQPGLGVLHGVVVDQAIRPVANATVSVGLAGAGPVAATTGTDGLFEFRDLPPGSYALRAEKPRHLPFYLVVSVRADDPDPPQVQVVLELQASEVPFSVPLKWEGVVGCATIDFNLCSVPNQGAGVDPIGDQSAHFFWEELVAQKRAPDAVQVEAVWKATLATSERMTPYVGWSTPEDWAVFVYDGIFDRTTQTSPSFYRISTEEVQEAKLGTECGLIVEFVGAGDDGDPVGEPPGLVVNQPVQLFVHLFYGYAPPEDWRFVTDGPPPPPPQ
ncbi:MAG TPA: carboxypeptidase-like regulatory domain-containing protein [Candidatus Thermoplasmatota archaeon]|nr:carboxypeptidase-like regulatory domain-containing protein [Candidatus Thermoplasmatota archaeon]